MALINLEPLDPAALAGLKTKVAEMEEREAARQANPRVTIQPATDGAESQYAGRLLAYMYEQWHGTLDYERGTHRFTFFSQSDEKCRRVSTFVQVSVDGETTDFTTRSYVLGPYLRVIDHRTLLESDDPWKVLHGDLSPILPSSGGTPDE